jgi:acyl-CoA dehydrogenase
MKYSSNELKQEIFPSVATGETSIQSLGLTEPNAGSDSTSIETCAERDGDVYVINGQNKSCTLKRWLSAQTIP